MQQQAWRDPLDAGRLPEARPVDFMQGESRATGKIHQIRNWHSWSDRRKLRFLRRFAQDYGHDPKMRWFVVQNVIGHVPPRDYVGQGRAILAWVQQNTYYVNEPGEQIQSPWRTIKEKAADCFPVGTLVLRDDYELVPIEQIETGDRIWGRDRWSTVENTWEKGELAVTRITLNNGSTFELTEDHKVYVQSCALHGVHCPDMLSFGKLTNCRHRVFEVVRIHVSELLPGMEVINPERIAFGRYETDPDRAYVEGLYLSDGWLHGKYASGDGASAFEIAGRDGKPKEAQKRRVREACERLGIETSWYEKSIRVRDAEWATRLMACGSRAPEKHALSINYIGVCARALYQGISADCGAAGGGDRAKGRTFTSTSRALAMQFRILAKMQGIDCSERYVEDHGGLGKNPVWRMSTRQGGSKHLRVKSIERGVRRAECVDIATDDHYVYLPEADVTVSNCDDQAVLIASMAEAIRLPWRFVIAGRDRQGRPVKYIDGTPGPPRGANFYHIYIQLGDRPFHPTRWYSAEPTVRGLPLGHDVVDDGVPGEGGGSSDLTFKGWGAIDGNGQDVDPAEQNPLATLRDSGLRGLFGRIPWWDLAIGILQGVLTSVVVYYVMKGRRKR